MNENKKAFVMLTCVVGIVGTSAYSYVKTIKKERAKRRQINADLQKSLGAIGGAYSTIVKRMEAGVYDGPNMLGRVMNDLEFEQIIEFNKD